MTESLLPLQLAVTHHAHIFIKVEMGYCGVLFFFIYVLKYREQFIKVSIG